jgi:hypothetical protein
VKWSMASAVCHLGGVFTTQHDDPDCAVLALLHMHCSACAAAHFHGHPDSGGMACHCRPSAGPDKGQDRQRTEAEGGDEELPTDLLAKLRRPAVPPCSWLAAADSSPSALLLCSPGDVDTLQR